jgi:hypothetical protein
LIEFIFTEELNIMRERSENGTPRFKRTRQHSRYNADRALLGDRVDLADYPYKTFPPDAPVQPGDRVKHQATSEGSWFTGTVVDEARLKNDELLVGVRWDGGPLVKWASADTLIKFFDYDALTSEARIVVQQKTGELKTLVRSATQVIIDIGTKLIEVKGQLDHGQFGKWLAAEFAWSERTAQNFMSVAEAFKSATVSDLSLFSARALYMLSAPSTPEPARQVAIQRAESGEKITHKVAGEIIAAHKPAVPPARPSLAAIAAAGAVPVKPVSPNAVKYGKIEDDYTPDVDSVVIDDEPVVIPPVVAALSTSGLRAIPNVAGQVVQTVEIRQAIQGQKLSMIEENKRLQERVAALEKANAELTELLAKANEERDKANAELAMLKTPATTKRDTVVFQSVPEQPSVFKTVWPPPKPMTKRATGEMPAATGGG